MLDPIIKEIRRLRAKHSKELARDPIKAMEECERKVMAMATNVVHTGHGTFTATFKLPTAEIRKKQRIRPKKPQPSPQSA